MSTQYFQSEAHACKGTLKNCSTIENFDHMPEIEEENVPGYENKENGAFYYRWAKAFPQSQILKSKEVSTFYYNGEDYLPTHLSHNIIITENDNYGSTVTIKWALITREDISFMPVDIEEYNEYINNIPHYVLRLYSYLVNGQKAVVTISGIKVFFDIRVPDNENTKLFESKIKDILVRGKNDEGETVKMTELRIEYVKAFPIRGIIQKKKTYLRMVTTTAKQRSIALAIILNYNIIIGDEYKLETASDDLRAYYRKVA
ncbi:hypothetical protein C2G38_2156809 [Gigaspora rosea]|uniref:Uncharacterized protein n=1 Tax=Gigaspora rosea TaxID=44941 RepID=A0A397W293_9GLOM|nr:hypothetical protein C2G38_2156809 [Gigaspora rosea]